MSNAAGNSREQIEAYLEVLRRRLKGIDEQDAREIVAELRSHIFETATVDGELTKEGVAEALAALGGPEELAREYVTDNLLARVEVSRSPVRVLESLYQWAILSAGRIRGGSGAHSLRVAEATSSEDGGTVELPNQHRGNRDIDSAGIWKPASGRPRTSGMVDHSVRSDWGLHSGDADFFPGVVVRAAIPQIAERANEPSAANG